MLLSVRKGLGYDTGWCGVEGERPEGSLPQPACSTQLGTFREARVSSRGALTMRDSLADLSGEPCHYGETEGINKI